MCEQVSGGRAIEMACEEISLFFFAVGILYLLLVFFAIQVRNLNRWWSIYVKHRLLRPRDVRAPPLNGSKQEHQVHLTRDCCFPAPSTPLFQHHSADNVVQPSSATSVSSAIPRSETPDTVSTSGKSRGSLTSTAVDTGRQQSPLQDRHYNHIGTVSAAAVAGRGRRAPKWAATIVEDDGNTTASATTASSAGLTGRQKLESKDDGAPSGRFVGQTGSSDIADRSLHLSESRNGPVSSQSRQRRFPSCPALQDALAGSRRVSVGGEDSKECVPEAAVTAPTSPAAAVVMSREPSAGPMAAGAKDEVGWPGNLRFQYGRTSLTGREHPALKSIARCLKLRSP